MIMMRVKWKEHISPPTYIRDKMAKLTSELFLRIIVTKDSLNC